MIQIHIHIHIHMHIHIHIHIHMYTDTCTYTYIYIYIHMYSLYIGMYINEYVLLMKLPAWPVADATVTAKLKQRLSRRPDVYIQHG